MDIKEYIDNNGKSPFSKWIRTLDLKMKARIRARLRRIEVSNNLGDAKQLKGHPGLFELRFHFGPGYRVYFGKDGSNIILLLIGGDKSGQKRAIKKAQEYWEDYNA